MSTGHALVLCVIEPFPFMQLDSVLLLGRTSSRPQSKNVKQKIMDGLRPRRTLPEQSAHSAIQASFSINVQVQSIRNN